MTKSIEEMIAVMQAAADGKPIECKWADAEAEARIRALRARARAKEAA